MDPYFRDYSPVSSYSYVLNCPLFFVDIDGKYLIDQKDKFVTYDYKVDSKGNVILIFDVTQYNFDPATLEIISALLTTPNGHEALMNYLDQPHPVTFTLTEEFIYESSISQTPAHAHTEYIKDGKDVTMEMKSEDSHNADVSIRVNVSVANIGDPMDTYPRQMKINVITSHEAGHVGKDGLPVDLGHSDGVRNAKSLVKSPTLYINLVASLQYSVKNDIDFVIAPSNLKNYKVETWGQAIDQLKKDAAEIINKVVDDSEKANALISKYNSAVDKVVNDKKINRDANLPK